jgi:hypothetical protein
MSTPHWRVTPRCCSGMVLEQERKGKAWGKAYRTFLVRAASADMQWSLLYRGWLVQLSESCLLGTHTDTDALAVGIAQAGVFVGLACVLCVCGHAPQGVVMV